MASDRPAPAAPKPATESAPAAPPAPGTRERRRRLVIAALVYAVAAIVFASFAGRDRLTEHTPFNHYALLADAWLHGRQDLPHGPPSYAQNNDFAEFAGKTYISFPPFPAVLMLPFVKLAGSPENFRDGQFMVWIAGFGPAFLFLVLEKLRRSGVSPRTERQNIVLSLLFAFGTVYFFTAVEGTVWFAAMVVAVALQALYALFALDAEQPLLAGLMLACAYMTRPPMLLAAPLFALEAARVSGLRLRPGEALDFGTLRAAATRVDWVALGRRYAVFAAPILVAFAINSALNHARYHTWSPFDPGHEYLAVAWRSRMQRWGIVSYHFLGKNLGIALSSLPWLPPKDGAEAFGAPFKVNEHGLALWFTTPLYLWLLWPKRFDGQPERKWLYGAVVAAVVFPALMDLCYQNSGWRQFGYRFSNDYAVLLFVLLAVGARPMKTAFAVFAAWGLAWNVFGAATFDKSAADRFYFREGSQTVVYQPD